MSNPFIVTAGSGEYNLPPSGNHYAWCYMVVHIGTIEEEFNGSKKEINKIRLGFELPNAVDPETGKTPVFNEEIGPQPYVISKDYTMSLDARSNLSKDIQSWTNKTMTQEQRDAGIDISKFLGKPCMVSINHVEKKNGQGKYASISSISSIPAGTKMKKQSNESLLYSVSQHNQEVFDKLPEFIRKQIQSSKEFSSVNVQSSNINNSDDDIEVIDPDEMAF